MNLKVRSQVCDRAKSPAVRQGNYGVSRILKCQRVAKPVTGRACAIALPQPRFQILNACKIKYRLRQSLQFLKI